MRGNACSCLVAQERKSVLTLRPRKRSRGAAVALAMGDGGSLPLRMRYDCSRLISSVVVVIACSTRSTEHEHVIGVLLGRRAHWVLMVRACARQGRPHTLANCRPPTYHT